MQVGVEGSDGTQDRLELAASLLVGPDRDLLAPPPVELARVRGSRTAEQRRQ
ncbi:hypothetical protein AB0L13_00030 [Saccharopolyspora shandongensis]|uniref:hypothetical protein n=1 Tax=Saccharopolyspora shandongensis TaxID=418495 RepID=UPI00344208F6